MSGVTVDGVCGDNRSACVYVCFSRGTCRLQCTLADAVRHARRPRCKPRDVYSRPARPQFNVRHTCPNHMLYRVSDILIASLSVYQGSIVGRFATHGIIIASACFNKWKRAKRRIDDKKTIVQVFQVILSTTTYWRPYTSILILFFHE